MAMVGGDGSTADEEDDLDVGIKSQGGFARWQIELANKVTVEREKEADQARRAFKEQEEARLWNHKQVLHRKTGEEFGKTQKKVEEMRQANRDKAVAYKEELALMRTVMREQSEEWAQFGHELTVEYGTDQAHRTKARLAESEEEKARRGQTVRSEEKRREKQLASQREITLDEKRQHVQRMKSELTGPTEEALAYSLQQRQGKADSVKRTEQQWKEMAQQDRASFLAHAAANKEKAVSTKDLMRTARGDLIKGKYSNYQDEQRRKKEAEALIALKRSEATEAKQHVHDKVYSERRVSPEKTRVIKEVTRTKSPKKAAKKAGLVLPPEAQTRESPYRLA
jgi:hypothetical protein